MGFGRREFIGLAAGLAAGAAASPAPWRAAMDLTRLGQQSPDLPAEPLRELNTVSLACPTGLGITVLSANGRPLRIRGNPEHPLSQGAITPLAQAEAYNLSHPGRILGPLLKNSSGVLEPASWAVALSLLAEKLRMAGEKVMSVGPARQGVLQDLLSAFMAGLGSSRRFRMPSEGACARAAAALMGAACQPGYDVDNAKGLLLLGADAFESMPASPHFRASWAGRSDVFSAFFGPVRGASAALCGEWHPLPAGAQASLAMGLAWHLADMGLVTGKARDMADFIALVRQRFGPEEVRLTTGLEPETVRRAALRVAEGALPILGDQGGEGLGLTALVAGFALPVMTGRVNRPGGVYLTDLMPGVGSGIAGQHPEAPKEVPQGKGLSRNPGWGLTADTRRELGLPGELKRMGIGRAHAPDVLLLVEADPVAGLPETELVARGVGKAAFKAAFTPVMTASARLCDLILPAPMPLERWDDVTAPYGLAFACYGLARPLVRAGADARHPGDVLLELAARLGRPMGPASFRQALRERVLGLEKAGGFVARGVPPWLVLAGEPQPAPEADLWKALVDGHLWVNPEPVRAELSCNAAFLAKALAPEAVDLGLPLRLAPQASLRTCAPEGVPLQSVTSLGPDEVRNGKSVLRLNGATAKMFRVEPGDRVRLVSPAGRIEALVAFDESVMNGHVALLLGLGEGLGADVRQAQSSWTEPESGIEVWSGCRVRLERV